MKQISIKKKPDHLYRKGVGIMLINEHKQIFVGKRIDNHSNAWQMPQGGIDDGENEDLAVMRELYEETGVTENNIQIISKSNNYFYYNLPYNLQKKFWDGRYIGQKQRWYLLKFFGDDNQINLSVHSPEFSNWQWVDKQNLINLIVNFKQDLYKQVIQEFDNWL